MKQRQMVGTRTPDSITQGRTRLIAEDNCHLRQLLCRELEDLGCQVNKTGCCSEAICAKAEQTFELALLDYHLPDGTGCVLMGELRRRLAPAGHCPRAVILP